MVVDAVFAMMCIADTALASGIITVRALRLVADLAEPNAALRIFGAVFASRVHTNIAIQPPLRAVFARLRATRSCVAEHPAAFDLAVSARALGAWLSVFAVARNRADVDAFAA